MRTFIIYLISFGLILISHMIVPYYMVSEAKPSLKQENPSKENPSKENPSKENSSQKNSKQETITTIYLVRHAEKDLSKTSKSAKSITMYRSDPSLTAQGRKRAQHLAYFLQNVPLDAIYSTNFKRTRDTALPTAQQHKLTLQIYHPHQLNIDELSSKTTLIVGHSNTIPNLVNTIIGQKVYPSIKEHDYTHVYQIVIHKDHIGHTLFHLP